MRIVVFNWRDLSHPKAGGAEVATDQLAHGLALRGHHVTWFTSRHRGATTAEHRNGYEVRRAGSEVTCRVLGFVWLLAHRKSFDVVIDEVNTLPFLSRLIAPRRQLVWMHQLAREVWLLEAPRGVGRAGYALEPLLMWMYRKAPIVTISESSAQTFRDFGFRGPITVAEIALQPPVRPGIPSAGRIGYVGRVAPSKRVDHIIRALRILRGRGVSARLVIVGSGMPAEIERLRGLARELQVDDLVEFTGRVTEAERDRIMETLDLLALTSVREGWGLVVSEGARFGVPSVVYPVAGLVDSVRDGQTGIVCADQSPQALAAGCAALIADRGLRDRLGAAAAANLFVYDEERFVGRIEGVLAQIAAQGDAHRRSPG